MNADIVVNMRPVKRIYLDVCCLNRPFDDQDQDRVRLEAEAVKLILLRIGSGHWQGVGSEAIDFEIEGVPDPDRQLAVTAIAGVFSEYVPIAERESRRGLILEELGFDPMDALHLACAETARSDVLLTTDDSLLKKAARNRETLKIRVANPLTWLEEVLKA
jgi:hypothetical protein